MRALSLVAASVCLTGCGYVGEPLPPSLNIPNRVGDLRVVEHADKLVITFTASSLTTDGVALEKLGAADLRAGPAGNGPFDLEKWAAQARPIPTNVTRPGPVRLEIPAGDWVGHGVIFGVRVSGRKGRFSHWSNLAVLQVVPPLQPPLELRAEATPEGVRLTWQAPQGLAFRVYRSAELVAQTGAPQYLDTSAQFGRTYQYAVQSVLKEAESEISKPVEITPVDQFPPAVPTGLTAIAAVQSIELTWDRNTEPDLKGYYLHRSGEGGPFQKTGDLLETPSYSDRAIEPGKGYRYAVSAVDQLGNESARSAPVGITAP